MTRQVWKQSVPVDGEPHLIEMPLWSQIIHVQSQDQVHSVEFWYEVDSDRPMIPRKFQVFGTGHEIPDEWGYVGSTLAGPLVWHLYEAAR